MNRTMMIISVAVASITIAGCSADWGMIETRADQVAAVTEQGEQVATVLAPFTAGYGGAVAVILGGLGTIAGAVSSLAKSKKVKSLAAAAVEAADSVPGGGKAITAAALANGVIGEVKTAHKG